jgi:hypothetical protein
MSFANRTDQKRLRLYNRLSRKQASAKEIPHGGVIVRKVDVRRHKYLADHKLPHSKSMTSVFVGYSGHSREAVAA